MAYYRQSVKRGRFSSRSRYVRRGTGTRFVGTRYSGRVNGREVPYYLGTSEAHVIDTGINFVYDTAGSAGTTNTSVFSSLLNAIPRGTGIFERDSQRASMRYLILRMRASLEPALLGASGGFLMPRPVTVRFMLVYSTRQLASISASDFLSVPAGAGGTASYATAAVQRIDSRENYQILYDNKFVLRNTNTAQLASAGELRPQGDFTFRDIDVRIPISRPVSFTSTSVSPIALPDITSGSLHFFCLVDSLYGAPTFLINASVVGSVRLVFSP